MKILLLIAFLLSFTKNMNEPKINIAQSILHSLKHDSEISINVAQHYFGHEIVTFEEYYIVQVETYGYDFNDSSRPCFTFKYMKEYLSEYLKQFGLGLKDLDKLDYRYDKYNDVCEFRYDSLIIITFQLGEEEYKTNIYGEILWRRVVGEIELFDGKSLYQAISSKEFFPESSYISRYCFLNKIDSTVNSNNENLELMTYRTYSNNQVEVTDLDYNNQGVLDKDQIIELDNVDTKLKDSIISLYLDEYPRLTHLLD